jgi:hypothetical protein
MLSGYNTNVSYRDEVFHVQTETGGDDYPFITTLLYYQGAILYSRKTGYADLLENEGWVYKVVKIMKRQHMDVINDLEEGKFKEVEEIVGVKEPRVKEPRVEEKKPEVKPVSSDLDEIIMGYIISDRE